MLTDDPLSSQRHAGPSAPRHLGPRAGQRCRPILMPPNFQLGDLVAMHFIRAIGQAQQARGGIGAGQPEVVVGAAAPMGLDRLVDHLPW